MKRFFVILIFLSCFSQFSFCEDMMSDKESSYDNVKFPQWAKDLRRTEIITLGSLPFVTLWTTFGYSYFTYRELRNPLNRSSDNFTTSDQKRILKTAVGISVGLGITDLIISLIRRNVKKRLGKNTENTIFVSTEKDTELDEKKDDYLIKGVVESAIF